MNRIRLGTRASDLALWQAHYVRDRLGQVAPDVDVELVEISSKGDEMTNVPIDHMEGTGFFTSTLERALLSNEVDIAVHSCKDLPVDETEGLMLAAIPERGPVEDVLCAKSGTKFAALPKGARIGTCSLRRTAQMRALRDDLEHLPLRGNLPTRVQRVVSGELDAIVMARAGLYRLGLMDHVTDVFPVERVLPAPAQGALAIQMRTGESELETLLARLDDTAAHREIEAERTLLHALGGGCSVPVGALARIAGRSLSMSAAVFEVDTGRAVRVQLQGEDATDLGKEGAQQLVAQGADAILAEVARAKDPSTGAWP